MKLFLVGPKYDLPNSNFPEFHKTAQYWRNIGHTVISSAELDIADGADPEQGWTVPMEEQYISDLFRRDVAELVTCDAIILLKGWKLDDQSQMMADLAEHCDMTAFESTGEENYYQELNDDEEYEFYNAEDHPEQPRDKFREIMERVITLHDKKQKDYGKDEDPYYNMRSSERYGIPAWVSAMIRSEDKSHRIQKAYLDGSMSLVNESIEDSFEDKLAYDAMAYVLFQEERDK